MKRTVLAVLSETRNPAYHRDRTNALSNEADIAKVQDWLGHADVSTTRLYDRRDSNPEDSPRAALEKPGFGLVVEAGLGAGPEAFRSMSIHTFPSSLSPEEIWSRQVGTTNGNVENMPAYEALKRGGMDTCGLAQLASRTVGVPFVGLVAACLVISELLRRLNGGRSFELISCSAAALGDIESIGTECGPYAYGHLPVAKCQLCKTITGKKRATFQD